MPKPPKANREQLKSLRIDSGSSLENHTSQGSVDISKDSSDQDPTSNMWYRYPVSSISIPLRDEKRERSIWDRYVQPVLKTCKFNFDYEFREIGRNLTPVDLVKIERTVFQTFGFSAGKIMDRVKRGRPIDEKTRTRLYDFIEYVVENEDHSVLPAFLELIARETNFNCTSDPPVSTKKLRPSQEHKQRCRKAAKKLWEKDPSITISAMAKKDEIIKACDGKSYAERTLRKWIKDLCSNNKPGRRPGT